MRLRKKIFKEDNQLTNEIYSDMLMGDPQDFDLPKDAAELNIIRNGRLFRLGYKNNIRRIRARQEGKNETGNNTKARMNFGFI